MKRVKEKLTKDGASPEDIKAFEGGVNKFAKSRLTSKSFEKPDWEFYIGESMDVEGMCVFPPPPRHQLLIHPRREIGLFSSTIGRTTKLHTWSSGSMVSGRRRSKVWCESFRRCEEREVDRLPHSRISSIPSLMSLELKYSIATF